MVYALYCLIYVKENEWFDQVFKYVYIVYAIMMFIAGEKK